MESVNRPNLRRHHQPRSALTVLVLIFLVIIGLYVLLELNDAVPLVAWAPLILLWFLYRRFGGKFNLPTPQDFPILALLLVAVISLTYTGNKELAFPKFYGLLLGAITFYFIVTYIRHKSDLKLPIRALVVMPLVLAIVGLVTSQRILGLGFVSWLLSKLTSFSTLPSTALTTEIINPNTLAGALAFSIPLLVSLLWDKDANRHSFSTHRQVNQGLLSRKSFIWVALIISVFALVLSGSRGAIIGSALGVFLLAVFRDRRFIWAIPVLVLSGLLIVYLALRTNLPELIAQLDINADLPTLQYRREIWDYSLTVIKDFPLTGIGLNQFDHVWRSFYLYSSEIFTNRYIAHPHNTFFAVAVELGLPALVLYSGLISAFFAMAWRSWQSAGELRRVLIIGLTSGMLAHLVFGVMDAFTLGKSLGVFLWIYLAMMTAIHRLGLSEHGDHMIHPSVKQGFQQPGLWLAFWFVASLLAMAFVTVNALLGFFIALLGGVFAGVMTNHKFEAITS